MEICPKCKAIGIYYDDPRVSDPFFAQNNCNCQTFETVHLLQTVPETNLRWLVGMILEINGESKVEKETLDELKAKQYRFAYFPAIKQAIVTKFPLRNILSVLIAPMKVYGAINRYNQVK